VNLEELVQAALTTQASAAPEEAGAYDRFLCHRRRRAWRAAGSAGLAVALVLGLAVGGAWLVGGRHQQSVTGPVTTGMVRYPAQGFALTLPAGWEVDQELTRGYHRMQQEWLVLAPVRRDPQAGMVITIYTEVADPPEYPGRPGTWKDRQLLGPTQGNAAGLTGLGRRSSGRRADGRPFAAGTQHSMVTYLLAWPYYCPGQGPCPLAARWRVLRLEAVGRGAGWPEVQRVVRRLVETVQPITNALAGGPFQPEEPGFFGEPLRTLARGGQGDYVWEASGGRRSAPPGGYWVEVYFPKVKGGSSLPNVPGDLTASMMCVPQKAGVIYGAGPRTVVTVRIELAGRPAVRVPTAVRDKNLPFTVWVLSPLPRNVQVRAVIGLDAAGRQVGRPAKWVSPALPDGATGAVCRA
jgi:hypothetical protein